MTGTAIRSAPGKPFAPVTRNGLRHAACPRSLISSRCHPLPRTGREQVRCRDRCSNRQPQARLQSRLRRPQRSLTAFPVMPSGWGQAAPVSRAGVSSACWIARADGRERRLSCRGCRAGGSGAPLRRARSAGRNPIRPPADPRPRPDRVRAPGVSVGADRGGEGLIVRDGPVSDGGQAPRLRRAASRASIASQTETARSGPPSRLMVRMPVGEVTLISVR